MESEYITNYLKENGQYIILVVVLILGSMVFFALTGIDLNPVVNDNIEKVVTIEKFSNFCENNKDLHKLENLCNSLTKDNCDSVECCDYFDRVSTNKCKAVNKYGAIFNKDIKENYSNLDNNYYNDKFNYKNKNIENTYLQNKYQEDILHRLQDSDFINKNMKNRAKRSVVSKFTRKPDRRIVKPFY